ncbi:MAG: LPS assembly lipoprotein LptE [Candidatus Accumulibacter sp.]|nr:LPS assembly lipoprotein LptE [Accumulibacter sp.]
MIRMARDLVFALAVLALTGCGFQLRGAYSLPYESLYVAGRDNVVVAGLKRAIQASGGTRIEESAESAQATFVTAGEWRDSIIVSLSGSGRVREKRLRYRYAYRIVDAKGRDLVPQSYVELSRDVTYADSVTLAKTQEEELLWRDMENDLVQQLMRRLAAVKPKPPEGAE